MTADRARIVALTAGELADAVRSGTIAAVEVARAYLAQIEATAADLRAYVRTTPELALAEAAAIDAARARGEPLGSLAGVPYGLKDSLVTAGVATAAGSRILEGWIPPYDGAQVRRMRAAGAVLLGKLALDEFGMGAHGDSGSMWSSGHAQEGMSGGECPQGHARRDMSGGEAGAWPSGHLGPRNPWSAEFVPGGSSSGAAAAVAGRAAAVAVGSDTGGSIRVPAARCGLVGVRPTWGRVSRAGLVAFASSLDVVGPLARTVDDAARMLACLAGHDAEDSTSLDEPVPDYAAMAARGRADGLAGVSLGIDAAGLEKLEPAVAEVFAAALTTLAGAGARLVAVALPPAEEALAAYAALSAVEAVSNLARYDGVRLGLCVPKDSYEATAAATRGAGFGLEVKRRLVLGAWLQRQPELLVRARAARAAATAGLEGALRTCDALVSPTCAEAGVRVRGHVLGDSERSARALADLDVDRFTVAASLAGLPALSLPAGLTAGAPALPVGLHLVGRRLDEGRLLAIAAAFEAATPWRARLLAGPGGA
ncbi:amidase [Nannocystis radixulma]|uniref:Amidase family protein n=1 Tax=Nannocystis radixulma TaxID=2995305 RepID=A0ABT5BM93_9BACT|nr:amidase family protein [Nannocystis radixulma]MDC0674680.1 amidase family protein [Nannocystis radixulma]